MTSSIHPHPCKPVLQVVSFSGDAFHILGFLSFLDPDEGRQFNVEATACVSFKIWPAHNQAHLPNGGLYLEEATRIATGLVLATFPHFVRDVPTV
jgi:hypothetical protein